MLHLVQLEKKQEAINRVNTLKNRALTDIGVTSTTAMVNSIRDDAVNQIGAVQPHVTKKQTATGVLNDLATAKSKKLIKTQMQQLKKSKWL